MVRIQDSFHLYKVKQRSIVIFGSIEADPSFWLSTIGFSSMLDIVMGSESIIGTALLGFFFKWPPLVQGKTINIYPFQHKRSRFVIFFEMQS